MNNDFFGTGFIVGIIVAGIFAVLIPNPDTLPIEWEWAEKMCATNGGVDRVRASGFFTSTKAVCKNDAVFVRRANSPPPE